MSSPDGSLAFQVGKTESATVGCFNNLGNDGGPVMRRPETTPVVGDGSAKAGDVVVFGWVAGVQSADDEFGLALMFVDWGDVHFDKRCRFGVREVDGNHAGGMV